MLPEVRHESLVEVLLLTADGPLSTAELESRLPLGADVLACLDTLSAEYSTRSLMIAEVAGGWAVRTRPEHSGLCRDVLPKPPRISKAAMETLAVIAYFQPVTRPEIERVRGVALAKGTLDILIWAGWVRPGARRQTPGNPLTFMTTDAFLLQYALGSLDDLPDVGRLREEGVLDARPDIGLSASPAAELTSD